jgi:hypothetical protein
MLALLSVVIVPEVLIAVWNIVDWFRPGYYQDIIPGTAYNAVLLAPALLLGAMAIWIRKSRGRLVVTSGCAILAASELLGFGLALSSNSSTAVLVFIPVKAVQWLTAIICGVIVTMSRSLTAANAH